MSDGNFPFRREDRVLFTLNFNVQTDDFNEFMEQVTRALLIEVQPRWLYGNATVLPCPTVGRIWIVIILEARDREMHYRVPFFIDATTIYLIGYQNQEHTPFEFKPQSSQNNMPQQKKKNLPQQNKKNKLPQQTNNNLPQQTSCLVGSTALSFECNYIPMTRHTRYSPPKGEGGAADPGFILAALPARNLGQEQPQRERDAPYRPNFGQERLITAVKELAQERNVGSQHRTAQNLILVIIRFCESIRNLSVRREMVDLWTVPHRVAPSRPSYFPEPSRCISATGIRQIKNWSTISSALINHIDGPFGSDGKGPLAPNPWPSNSISSMGVASLEEAQRILVVVLFSGKPKQGVTPQWRDAQPDNNNRNKTQRRGPGPGPGGSGAGWSVCAAEVTPQPVLEDYCFLVPEDPLMEILGVFIPMDMRVRDGRFGLLDVITVTDNFGAQMIYNSHDLVYQESLNNSQEWRQLQLHPGRSISAYSCIDIDVEFQDQFSRDKLTLGCLSWNICNYLNNLYGVILIESMRHARLMYIVYREAVQVTVSVTVNNPADFFTEGTFSTRSTYFTDMDNTPVGEEGLYLPRPTQRPLLPTTTHEGQSVLYRQVIITAPLNYLLKVTVSLFLEPDMSGRPV